MTWQTLDLECARLRVERQLVPTRGGPSFGPPKSRRSLRTIALDERTVEVLERDFAGPAYVDRDL